MFPYEDFDGLALAALVRKGEVTASELLDAALARIEAQNPRLNAIVTRLDDLARQAIAASLPKGPFEGVPFVLKELLVSLVGAPTTSASRMLVANMPAADSELVARYKRAGLVILGKTNSSEFGLAPATESHLFGETRNPWNLALSPGGSSGGSAAAVAARILPMGHATDGGGSIRIPASACGLFGLKPTRARITAGPEGGEGLGGLAAQHAVTRSVRDSAALLDATAGPMPGDPYMAPPPARSFLSETTQAPGHLRIAVSTRAPTGVPVDPACVTAVDEAARLCEELGHHVEPGAPDFDAAEVQRATTIIFFANTALNVTRFNGGRLPEGDAIEPLTRAFAIAGLRIPATDYIAALQSLHRQGRRIMAFYERFDVWLTPTLALPPQPIGAFDTHATDADAWMAKVMAFIPFTVLCNVTGQPAMSVPLHWSAEGLPIGVHFAARTAEEGLLYRLAAQLEQARPWANRRPPH
jgi:amidase